MMISENSRDRGPYFYCLKNTIFSNAAYTLKRYVALTFLIACPKKLKKKKKRRTLLLIMRSKHPLIEMSLDYFYLLTVQNYTLVILLPLFYYYFVLVKSH